MHSLAYLVLLGCSHAQDALPVADHFDYPVGAPGAKNYYDAQPFGRNNHLGSDWNGDRGGNTDLGDPVYAVANGWVTYAQDEKRGWGNVVKVAHELPDGTQVESLYAHLDRIDVQVGQILHRGQPLGTIGTGGGLYIAHLHFEIRDKVGLPVGVGYSDDTTGYLNPTRFLQQHR